MHNSVYVTVACSTKHTKLWTNYINLFVLLRPSLIAKKRCKSHARIHTSMRKAKNKLVPCRRFLLKVKFIKMYFILHFLLPTRNL